MIPTYNPRSADLKQALQSVLDQELGPTDMQIEVVDDNSSQVDVGTLVREIGGGRVTYFKNAVNYGLAGCWNTCIERSRGELIQILHQDDQISWGFYQQLGQLMQDYPLAGAAFCRHKFIDTEGNPFLQEAALQDRAGPLYQSLETIAIRNQIQCPAIVVRRSAYEKVGGFSSSFVFTLDWEMWVRIASEFPILYHPKVLASFRVHEGSETSRLVRTGENVHDSMRTIETFAQRIPASRVDIIQRQAREWVCDLALQKAHQFLKTKDPGRAMVQLRAALLYERRISFWIQAFRCWAGAILRDGRFIVPPLPFLPTSWFRAERDS